MPFLNVSESYSWTYPRWLLVSVGAAVGAVVDLKGSVDVVSEML